MSGKSGYINGSDILLSVAGKAVGHSTSHTTTYNSETKDRAVKPVSTATASAGLWKQKTVTGLSVSISAEGLRTYDETECSIKSLMTAWKSGQSVAVKGFLRSGDETPYLSGNFIIASIEEGAPAGDDVTYSVSLENNGEVTITESAME